MVRAESATGVSVKGRAANVILDTDVSGMRISNISEKGVTHLGMSSRVQVEFIMMSTKVVFVTTILAREQSCIVVAVPLSLLSIERRKNARYACSEDLTAFLDLSIWKPETDDATGPPFFSHHKDLAAYIAIADMSFGGLCAVSRFPAVNTVLRRGLIDDRARLILPMHEPLEVGIEIRWFKRIREHVKGNEDDGTFQRFFRFGIEFTSQSDAVRIAVRQFIQQVSQAGAI